MKIFKLCSDKVLFINFQEAMSELIVDFRSGTLSRCTKCISTVQSKLPFYTHGWLENSPPNFICISPMLILILIKKINKKPNKTIKQKRKQKNLYIFLILKIAQLCSDLKAFQLLE